MVKHTILGVKRVDRVTWQRQQVSLEVPTFYGDFGQTYIVIFSSTVSPSDGATCSSMYIVRCGYQSENVFSSLIIDNGFTDIFSNITFSSSNNILQVSGILAAWSALILPVRI